MRDTKDTVACEQSSINGDRKDKTLHYASRGQALSEENAGTDTISGFDAQWMRARTSLTAEEEKKLLRRVDWHIMPLCAIMFLLKNIDSENVANAKIMNKGTDRNILTQLGMTTDQHNLVTVLYYIPYIVAETPSNLLFKRFLPSRWQSRIMISWGIALACHTAVKNKEGLYAVRFLLGLFEAGLFPGVILQLCYWYRPDEMSLRLLYFYILGNFSGIISGVLAYAFDTVSGSHGLSGWQWLFLTEGIITVVFGILLIFIFPDFPPQAKWLTEKEKAFIQARLPRNAPRAEEVNFNFREIFDSLRDRRLWLFTLIWAFFTVGTHGLRFYQPTVIANLGFTDIATSQLLNIPTSVLTVICIGVFGIWADSSRLPRPLYPLSFLVVILACYGVLYSFPSNGAVYAVTVIANALGSAWFPLMWPWRVQTTSRATGSAFSIGFVNSYGQIGGAIGPQIFQSKYAPHYTVPFAVTMGLIAACILTTLVTWWITRDTERATRRLKLARLEAMKRGEAVLDDVVDNDLAKNRDVERSGV
ncbi:putative pantothenate transporter [Aspergillus nomiae NRRL 13137]|uniref:Putative pantothenate transporter n=1 Tax=Aspergillus nomiae NRRL (strain ATCC 15546 / NRRL 13137 / CBS 260.88 / M93) TaxID=1509407 RepID=A0A0L1J6Y7_ASPN3|nr:putative pantothenate transporter [Aspergillus nomiae NRRL 13137]KNG87188.1 putative pantothenate transporter [Aspergillus nomiae NRRL 13137]